MTEQLQARLKQNWRWMSAFAVLAIMLAAGLSAWTATAQSKATRDAAEQRRRDGQRIFRFDTFGDEQFWTGELKMHEVIPSSISPLAALELGLKVDVDALPADLQDSLEAGEVDLNDPAVTVTLLKLNAVVGLMGRVHTRRGVDELVAVGITCAICHSTVDNSFMPGIGRRLDGWPNLDLDPGRIIAASPAIPQAAKDVYNSWGPGFYDPRFNIDGLSTPLVLPPAFGLAGVDKETYTGEGPVSYWNNYVAVTQMGGHGTFIDPRLGINIVQRPDLVLRKLPALAEYQFSLLTPSPPPDSFDVAAAARGMALFDGKAGCATCHIPPLYTDVNEGILHDPAETGMDPAYAERTTTMQYRTTPLRALWQHAPYFHDGSAATLADVVDHYNGFFDLGLTKGEQVDLEEFLKSI